MHDYLGLHPNVTQFTEGNDENIHPSSVVDGEQDAFFIYDAKTMNRKSNVLLRGVTKITPLDAILFGGRIREMQVAEMQATERHSLFGVDDFQFAAAPDDCDHLVILQTGLYVVLERYLRSKDPTQLEALQMLIENVFADFFSKPVAKMTKRQRKEETFASMFPNESYSS